MKAPLYFLLINLITATVTTAESIQTKEKHMEAKGSFEVNLDPQKDDNAPAGRMLISKQYTGDMVGTGIGQMLSKRTDSGTAVYSAIEEFKGTVHDKTGTFTLVHNGYMSPEEQRLDIIIVDGSGEGELKNISGTLSIVQDNGKHSYILSYGL